MLRKDNAVHILAKIAFSAMVVRCWWANGHQQPEHRTPHLVLAASVFFLPYVLVALGVTAGPRFLREGRKEHGDEDDGDAEDNLETGGSAGMRQSFVWAVRAGADLCLGCMCATKKMLCWRPATLTTRFVHVLTRALERCILGHQEIHQERPNNTKFRPSSTRLLM